MRSMVRRFIALWMLAGPAAAATLTGVVRNGTTGQPAAGVTVVLINLQVGMDEAGSTKTDAQGRFEFRSVKPGKYPEGRNPAHVHFKVVAAGGYEEQFPNEIYFAGDPDLPPADRVPRSGKWNAVCAPTRDAAGVLHCTYNIRLE